MAWLAVLGFFYMRKPPQSVGAASLMVLACGALALAGGVNVYRHHSLDVERYAVKRTIPTLMASGWWTSEWQRLPPRRIDLTGEIEEPLTIQWAGDLSAIRQDLLSKGWRLPANWALSNTLGWLTAKTSPVKLPVTPHLDSGMLPSLTLVLQNSAAPNDTRFILRLWDADLNVMEGTLAPIWIGSVVKERVERPFALFSIVSTLADANTPRDILARMLGSGRIAVRSDDEADTDWDGRVLLLRTGH